MKREIVVGIDGSDASQAALEWAAERAFQRKTALRVINVVPDYWAYPKDGGYQEAVHNSQQLLDRAVAKVRGMFPEIGNLITSSQHSGEPAVVLTDLSYGVELIVVGTDKVAGFGWTTFGSTSVQVATVSNCDVAVIPLTHPDHRHGVVVGVDGSEDSLQAVAFAADEAAWVHEPLTAVHACQIPNPWLNVIPEEGIAHSIQSEEERLLAEATAGLGERYPDLEIKRKLEIDEAPARALIRHSLGARLLVIGTRGRSKLSQILLGSVSHNVLVHLPCPVVMVRLHKTEDQD